jgi:hypothetical protein
MTGEGVRSGSDTDYIADLLALGFLKTVDEPSGATWRR